MTKGREYLNAGHLRVHSAGTQSMGAILEHLAQHRGLDLRAATEPLGYDELTHEQLLRLDHELRRWLLAWADHYLFNRHHKYTNEQVRLTREPLTEALKLHRLAAYGEPVTARQWGNLKWQLEQARTQLDVTPSGPGVDKLYRVLRGAELLTERVWVLGAIERLDPLISRTITLPESEWLDMIRQAKGEPELAGRTI